MADNDKRIQREEKRDFEKYLFDNDFFEVEAPEEDAPEQAPAEAAEEAPVPLTEEDLAQAESDGYAKGLADGKQQAFEDYTAELKKHADKLATALENVAQARAEILEDTKQKAFKLLEVTADALLADARDNYAEALLKNAVNTLENLTAEQKNGPKIRVAPATSAFLTETLLEARKIDGIEKENIQADETLQPGDCVIEWVDGGTDFRLDKLKEDITKALQGAAKSDPPEGHATAPENSAEADEGPTQPPAPEASEAAPAKEDQGSGDTQAKDPAQPPAQEDSTKKQDSEPDENQS